MLPPDFVRQLDQLLGSDEAAQLCHAITQHDPPVSLRRNLAKTPFHFAPSPSSVPPPPHPQLEVQSPVAWCATGSYLVQRPSFTFDPRLHAGAYYVQEASSMFVEQAYRRLSQSQHPLCFLDLCAAPGGKSTLWRSLLPDEALLVANEINRSRAHILSENLSKWGHPNTICTNAAPADFAPLTACFDVIAADVPCSGEGMFRKDEAARQEWSLEAVNLCAQRQRSIIADVWDSLRTGGYLVYSTCTYNRSENEDNVLWICQELGAEIVDIAIDASWNIQGDVTGRQLPVYRFLPHRNQGEGFFLALLRKTAATPPPPTTRIKNHGKNRKGSKTTSDQPTPSQLATLRSWLAQPDNYTIVRTSPTQYSAIATPHLPLAQLILATLPCLTLGIAMAEEKGNKLIPQSPLALTTALAPEAFVRVALTYDQAIAYLRREAIVLPPDTPRGYVLLTYEQLPLGFANNLGSRANNLYPEAWRIRSRAR